MFKKSSLQSILLKYYLKGLINTTKWIVQDNVLSIDFQSSVGGIIGKLTYNNFPLENSQFVIYDTEQLIKLINILNEDIDISLFKIKELATRILIQDDRFKQTYFLSDLMLAPKVGKVKSVGTFEVNLDLVTHFESLIKAKEALPNSNELNLIVEKNLVKIIFGDNNNFSNKVEYEIALTTPSPKSFKLPFDADLFKDILYSNKDIAPTQANMEINSMGLIKLSFSKEDISTEYYVLRKSN